MLNNKEIYETLFDKKVDRRYLESAIQKFLLLNKKMLEFLGVDVLLSGADRDLSLRFKTSNQIGAIPIRMPYDGISRKDFHVIPRFDSNKEPFSELTQLLSVLEYSITPEYAVEETINSPLQLRPPLYYEAAKYIELFETAYKYGWVRFEVIDREHTFPKSNTNWNKYIARTADPRNALKFPAKDNILSTNHKEWQELKYVFDIAQNIITNTKVPASLRYKYQDKVMTMQRKVAMIVARKTDTLVIHTIDPACIKDVKIQANKLLYKDNITCMAWRMDMAELFERYVQHVVMNSIKGLSGTVIINGKINGKGNIPSWGIKYLEPDIKIKFGNSIYMADAKYKAHYYAFGMQSEVLNETHRSDLHQLLAYCSFEPQMHKTGLLFYPARTSSFQTIQYSDSVGGVCNKVLICGLPFQVDEMENTIVKLKELFQNNVLENVM